VERGFGCVSLATTAYCLGDLSTMRARLDEAQSIFEVLGVRIGLAWVLLRRGIDADDQQDQRTAAARYEKSLLLFRELDAVRGQAHALHSLGRLARLAHDVDTARSCFRESLELFDADGNPSGVSRTLSGLASLELVEGEPARAARLFGAAAAVPDASELPLFHAACADYDRCLTETGAAPGEPAFAAAWAEGKALSLEQAIEYALESEEHPRTLAAVTPGSSPP
jgi:ATP/maltotriose-dependent transcriptional regulator MalT